MSNGVGKGGGGFLGVREDVRCGRFKKSGKLKAHLLLRS